MKQLIFSAFLLLSLVAHGQDITDIFRTVPLPENWKILPETREQLIRYGKLSEDYKNKLREKYQDKLSESDIDLSFYNDNDTVIVDKKNAYLSIDHDGEFLTMCYWTKMNGDEKNYLVAVQSLECSSPACFTESINFFIYSNNQYYTCDPIYSQAFGFGIKDFFEDNATKKQMDLATVGLVYELPRTGKDIIVHCDLAVGDGVDDKQVEITKRLLKGNTIKLKYDDINFPFHIGEPYSGPCYGCGN
jgi:hypothetical protein